MKWSSAEQVWIRIPDVYYLENKIKSSSSECCAHSAQFLCFIWDGVCFFKSPRGTEAEALVSLVCSVSQVLWALSTSIPHKLWAPADPAVRVRLQFVFGRILCQLRVHQCHHRSATCHRQGSSINNQVDRRRSSSHCWNSQPWRPYSSQKKNQCKLQLTG